MTRIAVAVAGWFFAVMIIMVGAAYLWVWIYSMTFGAGGDQAFYEAYAQRASPVVAVLTAFPVFFAMGRFMRRFGRHALRAAFSVVALNLIADGLAVATMGQGSGYLLMTSAIALLLKVGGAWLGARSSPATAHA